MATPSPPTSARCNLCILRSTIRNSAGHEREARDFEGAARQKVVEELQRSPWRTQCGRDQPLDWHDPHGVLAAVEDLRGQLKRQELLRLRQEDEVSRLLMLRVRREVTLKSARERASRNRQREMELRSGDPLYVKRQQAVEVGKHDVHQRNTKMRADHDAAPLVEPVDTIGMARQRPWSAKQGNADSTSLPQTPHPNRKSFSAARRNVEGVAVETTKRLAGLACSRPKSILAHLLQAERGVDSVAADRRATPLPSPRVVVTPRVPSQPV